MSSRIRVTEVQIFAIDHRAGRAALRIGTGQGHMAAHAITDDRDHHLRDTATVTLAGKEYMLKTEIKAFSL